MMPRKKMFTVFGAAVLAIGLAACGGSSNTPEPVAEPEPVPAPPTDLEETQMAAADAAMKAKESSDAAATAASDAEAATMHIVDIQTKESAVKAAMDARKYADMAMAEYMNAKKASDAAAGAATGPAAETAWSDAVAAQDAAAAAAKTAGEKGMMATEAAMMEVMVDGTTKSVGDTSITIDGKTVTEGTDPVVTTGKTGDVGAMSMAVDAVEAVAAVPDAPATVDIDESKDAVIAKPGIASRSINIGVVYDSPDDSARVRLVTKYIGSGTVAGIYVGDGTTVTGGIAQADHAAYDHDSNNTTPDVRILKASGMFYQATGIGDTDTDVVEADTKGVPLYYYDVVTRNSDGDVTGRARTWLRRISTSTDAVTEAATHMYNSYTGDAIAGATLTASTAVRTTLKDFPMSMDFTHLHYGVWNSLNDKGTAIDDMGIGFVAATAGGSGMTGGDMPNSGSAEYNGQWVASVRGSGGGAITAQSGDSMMTADFAKDTVKVELMDLATLEGTISGDTFMGSKVSGVKSDSGDLAASEDGSRFEGSFSGGFFGAKAAEAGGVFDYTSMDMEHGEFRGAFGGAKDDE
ncbi:MAG: transferrin-binding protein-like solute binding protein [Alphaproteobacteria bacterium]|nr:transferrin-binding protein-like solute binding protein [Alphaproteobacteria bacterium]